MSQEETKKGTEEQKEKVRLRSRESKDKRYQPEEQKDEEEPKGFFGKYIWYILFFITFQIGMKYFNTNSSSIPKLKGVIEEGVKFDVNFYLSPKENLRSVKDLKPIYTIKDMIYSYLNFSSYSFDNLVNVTYNISYIQKKKNHKNAALYLIAEMKLKDDEFKRLNKYYKGQHSDFLRSINILKYVEDLGDLLSSAKDLDDFSAGRDDTKIDNSSQTNAIPKLFYKNNFILYIVRTEKEESLTTFQTYNIMNLPLRVNTKEMEYFPIMDLNDFWSMDSELTQINRTDDGLFTFKLNLNFNYIRSMLFSNMLGIQINDKFMYDKLKISGTKDVLVELIKNNSTFYLIILFTVNTLHTIFSVLEYSSDISYYKKLKRLDGVYTKYIFFNIFAMFITFVYILLKGANFMVKIELFISTSIEIWKLLKIFKVSFNFRNFPYIIKLDYKQKFDQEKSKDYETEAVNLMVKFLLIPIAFIYLGYRIYYYSDTIKTLDWKSITLFVIEYIYFLLNVFGFILLTPQIYLNYKLKSVEHLPLKAMTYKFLNTIIDDLFAFAVKTPTMYRIFCFRDDVIFVIYIYQIFKYKNNRIAHVEESENSKLESADKNKNDNKENKKEDNKDKKEKID